MSSGATEFPPEGRPSTLVATLAEVRARLGADLVWFGRLGAIAPQPNAEPKLWWSGLWTDGHPDAAQQLRTLDNRPVTNAACLETAAPSLTWRTTTYRPDAKGFWAQGFARNIYLRQRLQEEHRLPVASAAGLHGVLVAVWNERRTGVAQRLSRSLRDGHARWAHERLLSLLAQSDALGPPPAGVAVCSFVDGVLSASEAARPWLDSGRTPRFLRAVERSTRTDPLHPPRFAVDGAEVRLTALQGAGGLSWLAELQPLRCPQPEPRQLLTPSQAAVVELVVVGLAAPAIAEQLGKSVETVRSQIKQVYARLGVNSRVELARIMNASNRR